VKTLLITRPEEETQALEAALAAQGFATVTEPLLRIEPAPENRLALKKALARSPRGLLITSRQGLKALADMTATRSTPVLCVGAATAEAAAGLGFSHTHHCATAQGIPALARKLFAAAGTRLLYARGEHVSADIAATLKNKGFEVDSVVLYRAVPAESFSESLRSLISQGRITGALFFSRRTAEVYAALAGGHGLAQAHAAMSAVCISEAVAKALGALRWRKVRIAAKPDMAHMLKAAAKLL